VVRSNAPSCRSLELCGELTVRRPKFVLLTCHTPGMGRAELSAYLPTAIRPRGQPPRPAVVPRNGRRPAAAERGVCAVAWVNLAMPWRVFSAIIAEEDIHGHRPID